MKSTNTSWNIDQLNLVKFNLQYLEYISQQALFGIMVLTTEHRIFFLLGLIELRVFENTIHSLLPNWVKIWGFNNLKYRYSWWRMNLNQKGVFEDEMKAQWVNTLAATMMDWFLKKANMIDRSRIRMACNNVKNYLCINYSFHKSLQIFWVRKISVKEL